MEIEFDIKYTASALYDYNMHHNYTSAQGLIGTFVGILLVIGYTMNTDTPLMLAAGLLILLYNPVALFFRARKNVLLNPAFKNPMHIKMNDEGMTVSSGDDSMTLEWTSMYKAYSTNQSIILATSKINAWILPKKDLGEDRMAVIEMISTHMPPDRVKIKQ